MAIMAARLTNIPLVGLGEDAPGPPKDHLQMNGIHRDADGNQREGRIYIY